MKSKSQLPLVQTKLEERRDLTSDINSMLDDNKRYRYCSIQHVHNQEKLAQRRSMLPFLKWHPLLLPVSASASRGDKVVPEWGWGMSLAVGLPCLMEKAKPSRCLPSAAPKE